MKMLTKLTGFFVIEFLISLLIMGILFAIAAPIYQVYSNRAKTTEAMMLINAVKADVVKYYSYYGKLPNSSKQLNPYISSGSYISDISMQQNTITAKFAQSNEAIAGLSLSFTPALAKYEIPKVIKWVCGYSSVTDNFVLQGVNQTNIPPKYLTKTCRSSTGEL
ncbi:MAG: pilin [Candidatus Marithrix sp.]